MAPGVWQIIVVVLLILVVFGASRLPVIAENLAKGINSFKKGLKDDEPKSVSDKSDKEEA